MNKKLAAVSGVLLLIATFAFSERTAFFQGYLLSFVMWVQIALGSLCLMLIYQLTGGSWGRTTYPLFRAAAKSFWVLAILLVPVIFGLSHTHPWANANEIARDPHIQHKALYLNRGFFLVRQAIYFASWIYFAFRSSRKFSGGAMVAMGITITFASVDWMMSLEPDWYSTIYGMLTFASDCLSAFSWTLIALWLVDRQGKLGEPFKSQKVLADLGNLLLAFTMIWAYLSYFQYLIIWCGNLPEEAKWYLPRTHGGWQYVIGLIALFQFWAPFLLLLVKRLKRNLAALGAVACLVFFMRFVDTFWWVAPAFRPSQLIVRWSDMTALVAIGAIWCSVFFSHLDLSLEAQDG